MASELTNMLSNKLRDKGWPRESEEAFWDVVSVLDSLVELADE